MLCVPKLDQEKENYLNKTTLTIKKGLKIMKRVKKDSVLLFLLGFAVIFSIAGVVLNYMLLSSVDVPVTSISGRVTDAIA